MKKNPVIVETARIAAGLAICVGLMYGVFALLSKFSLEVLLGGIVGYLVAVGNFFFMAIGLMNIADAASDPRGVIKMQGNLVIRMLAIGAILIVAIKSGYCNVLATAIPLLLVRPVLTVEQFVIKREKGEDDKKYDNVNESDDNENQ